MNSQSLQNIRRMIQREEKARLSSKEILEKLIKNVAQEIRQNKLNQFNKTIEILQTSKHRQSSLVDQQIELIKKLIEEIKILSDRDLIKKENSDDLIDWTNLVQTRMNNEYTNESCLHAWQQICLPTIYYDQNWSSQEDQLLRNLVETFGPYGNNWNLIASHFPQRSTYLCANRFMFLENNRLNKLKFSNDEINQLKQVIQEYRNENYIPLNKVAYELGCSLSSVRREWRNIDPNVRRGQWNRNEDNILLESVFKQSNRQKINWNLVASDVTGRSKTKCFQRYLILTKRTTNKPFQPFDDQFVLQQHQIKNDKKQKKFSSISKETQT
ncbi:unnamed protein product [Rotaria sordida]|uniref:Myb-like DNA-binding domain containing protein n=3 Tax=Rotaria sordida TaxID=392033 RepID=A0A814MYN9_9BILA|nr:unnamed protein product [Rotaria sordida]CAF1152378.1 unnamed protein product [Rotaria sordida]CAF3902070.1 unnamed protein product [Rotaria sordida]CAF3948862.1 unnamed protein product [Rotaria sordida]